MSNLENAIVGVVKVFEQYAGQDENKTQLSKAEFLKLIQAELTSPEFKDKVDPENIKEVMDDLDKNRDGQVNFREFSQYVACLAKGYYNKKHGIEKSRRNK